MMTSLNVAVIGAGAAGLATAKELREEGHKVVIFERQKQICGLWLYNDQVEHDPLSLDPNRPIVHSSLYSSLRTNLPREVMGFRAYPFTPKLDDDTRDPRRFPGHREVSLYLQDYAREFELEEMVRFDTEVVYVGLKEEGDSKKWRVKSKNGAVICDEVYDAVVVCNGHYTEPRLAEIPGSSNWPRKQIHSHNYRFPEPFQDQVVVVIGWSPSAFDISSEIARVAKEVHVATRSVADKTYEEKFRYDNVWFHSMIKSVHEDGSVVFRNGRLVFPDVILHCTGYKYHFPFLETNGIVTVEDNRVGPLYKHVFPPVLGPRLSFVGIPYKVMPFRMFECQSKWIASVLSGRISLPSPEEMMEDTKTFYLSLQASNIPKRYTHDMSESQYEYYDWLAGECGCELFEEWRREMFLATLKNMFKRFHTYRDEWEDDNLILQATKDFANYVPKSSRQKLYLNDAL